MPGFKLSVCGAANQNPKRDYWQLLQLDASMAVARLQQTMMAPEEVSVDTAKVSIISEVFFFTERRAKNSTEGVS